MQLLQEIIRRKQPVHIKTALILPSMLRVVLELTIDMYSEGTKSRALPQNVEIRNLHPNNRENYERVGSENTPPEMLL
jgi:hypothetical protein